MTDIDALIEAVEAGTLWQGEIMSQAHGDLIDACFPLWDDDVGAWEYVSLAMDGSLDAAKRLHDALLPGEGWEVWRLNPKEYGCNLPGRDSAFALDPARAWLLAILRAVKATG